MSSSALAPSSSPAAQGVLRRMVGVVVSPGETFADVVRAPRPAGVLLIVCLVMGLVTGLPQFTARGQQQMLTLQRQQIERMGMTITPQMEEALARRAPYFGYQTMGSMFVVLPVASVLIAGFCWALFNIVLGGTATFRQVLGIVTHSQVIRALGAIAAAPIIWVQGLQSMAGPFNLGAVAPMLDPASTLASVLGALDFFSLWQIVVIAIGLGVLYRRRSTGIAAGLIGMYVGLVAIITVAFSAAFRR